MKTKIRVDGIAFYDPISSHVLEVFFPLHPTIELRKQLLFTNVGYNLNNKPSLQGNGVRIDKYLI